MQFSPIFAMLAFVTPCTYSKGCNWGCCDGMGYREGGEMVCAARGGGGGV